MTSRFWESEDKENRTPFYFTPAGGAGKVKKFKNLHNGFQDSSGKTMTEVATPRTEATPAATPTGAVEHRSQGHPIQGEGRCQGQEGHETKIVGTGRSVEDNPPT